MPDSFPPSTPRGFALMLGWRRLVVTAIACLLVALLLALVWKSGFSSLLGRLLSVGFVAMIAFGVFEQWPARLPRWVARWVVQVVAVAISIPVCTLLLYIASTADEAPPFWRDSDRLVGFAMISVIGLLLAPWVALAALVRQKDALARHQALAFDLERSELERRALDARLRLLQSQVEPHFLFNTLANIRALVAAGAPQACRVLDSLIAYLRAAVPRLHEAATTLGEEVDLVRAYLELMHMRMPDRLQFSLEVDPATRALRCPPTSLLTLVENAVRHGIDPGEEGGRIDVVIRVDAGRCITRVIDSGVGIGASPPGLGTGLSNLRERLQLAFAGDASLRIESIAPRGTCAELEFPARPAVNP